MSEETKITLGQRAEEKVKCCNCEKKILASEGFTYQDDDRNEVYVCAECRDAINQEIAAETENPNIIGGLTFGAAAGLIGGILWYWITVLTNYQIGYMAIGLGWLIAMGTIIGAGHKRGKRIQVLSAAITLVTLLTAEFIIFLHYAGQDPEINACVLQILANYNIAGLIKAFISSSLSPIGLIIWGVGLYVGYITPKAREL